MADCTGLRGRQVPWLWAVSAQWASQISICATWAPSDQIIMSMARAETVTSGKRALLFYRLLLIMFACLSLFSDFQTVAFILRDRQLSFHATMLAVCATTISQRSHQTMCDPRLPRGQGTWRRRRVARSPQFRTMPICARRPTSWRMLSLQRTRSAWELTRKPTAIICVSRSVASLNSQTKRWLCTLEHSVGQPLLTSF